MKTLIKLLFIGLFLIASMNFGQNIAGSAHDFSSESWSNSQICLPCHTPHDADVTVTNAPLWNHGVTNETFTIYSHPTGTIDATDLGQPMGISKLCLSCHDGSVALDAFDGATGTTFITGDFLIGTNLSNDHPISFTYDATLVSADGELHPTTATGVGGTIAETMLFNGRMECASCHDVHNGSGVNKLLVKSNAMSALCLTCHDK